jgi:hypothetical protein
MDAITADCQSSTAGGLGGEAIDEGIARSLTFPRALIDANLRAGSALLGFAGQCVHAEAEFLEQLFRCRGLEQASTLHARFVATMIGEGGRELAELMAVARENVALIADAAQTAQLPGRPSAV